MQDETAGARVGAGFQDAFVFAQGCLQIGEAAGVAQGAIADADAPRSGGNDAADGWAG